MKHFYKASLATWLLVLLSAASVFAQTTVSGKVTDVNGETLPGVSIGVKGLVAGTITDGSGNFSLTIKTAPPITLVITSINFKTQEIQITESTPTALDIKMEEDNNVLPEVAVTGGGIFSDETVSKSSFAVEKVRLTDLQKSPAAEVFDYLQHVKGVQFTNGSLNFSSINTRGFATIANTRFVQMVDGMDVSAPLLNFPTGNIVGIGELDLESMELLPGTSSGIYGPNAFNGLLLMNSKSPFDYQGLSAQFKGGFTTSDAQNGNKYPLFNYGVRYAKAFNDKIAFKVNFNVFQGEDWHGTDYQTDVNRPASTIDLRGTHNFDGLNLYGDETRIPVPLPQPFAQLNGNVPLDLRRTGWQEEFLVDDYGVKSIKGDAAIHYRPTDKIEVMLNYRYGGGSSVYQGSQKYALRDFTQQFFKGEVRSKNWFVRGYVTATDAGDSYNMGALGSLLNEKISPTAAQWAPTYAQNWILASQGYGQYDDGSVVPGGDAEAAHAYARYRADAGRRDLEGNPTLLRQTLEEVRNGYFQQGGAKFKDNSRLYHAQFNYNFADIIKFAEVMVGGNIRQYSLFSDGTIFNENPEEKANFKRIKINEFGVYTQVTKDFEGVFKLVGSIRYDKNENFDGQFTPRASAIYSFGPNKNHNIRASFQTGFRNPDSQSQFIYFPVGTNTLIGSTKANAERYGIYNGGSWTRTSYEQYLATGDESVLQTANIDYIQPEKLNSFDVSYKATIGTQLFLDASAYFNSYTDFLGSLDVAIKNPTTHQGTTLPAGTIFSPYVNVADKVKSQGYGVGITYKIFPTRDYLVTAAYNYAKFEVDNTGYRTGFNTPNNKFNVGLSSRKVVENLGFSVNFRWQESFMWESDFGSWEVPEFGVLDAQVSYKVPSMKTVFKVGGQNIGGGDYRSNFGSAFVGQQYYISVTFDQFMK